MQKLRFEQPWKMLCQGWRRGKLTDVGPMAAAQLGEDGGVEVNDGRRVWVLREECAVWICVSCIAFCIHFFFSFFFFNSRFCWLFSMNIALVYYLQTHKFHFSATFSLKMGPTSLFTHLKIILLQCFQFSISAK